MPMPPAPTQTAEPAKAPEVLVKPAVQPSEETPSEIVSGPADLLPKEDAKMPSLRIEDMEDDLEFKEKPKAPEPEIIMKPINVIAQAKGYYKRQRYAMNDKFTIDGPHHLAKWMKAIK